MDALLPAAAARTPGFGLAWGAVMLLVLAVPAWHWYSPSARGITVAVTQVAQMASGASKLSEGPLLVPGCPAWVAVAGPLRRCRRPGHPGHGADRQWPPRAGAGGAGGLAAGSHLGQGLL